MGRHGASAAMAAVFRMRPRDFPSQFRGLGAAMLLMAVPLTGSARAQDIMASVNGEPITVQDVEQRRKLLEAASPTHTAPSRQDVLEMLIDEEVSAPESRRWGINPSDQHFKDIANPYLSELRRAASIEYK